MKNRAPPAKTLLTSSSTKTVAEVYTVQQPHTPPCHIQKKWKANEKQNKGIMESGSPVLIADIRWQEGPSQYPYSLQPPILLRFEHTFLCRQKECATSCNPILAHISGTSLCRQKSGHIRCEPTATMKYHTFRPYA